MVSHDDLGFLIHLPLPPKGQSEGFYLWTDLLPASQSPPRDSSLLLKLEQKFLA